MRALIAKPTLSFVLIMGTALSIQSQATYSVPPSDLDLRANDQETRKSISGQLAASRISLNFKDSTVEYLLNEIARQSRMRMAYNNKTAALSKRVTVKITDESVTDALSKVLKGTNLVSAITSDGETIVIRQVDTPGKSGAGKVQEEKGVVNGRVVDSSTNSPISGVSVRVESENLVVLTDSQGRFRLNVLSPGKYVVSFKVIGYRSYFQEIEVKVGSSTNFEVSLHKTDNTLAEVVTTVTGPQRRVEIANDIVTINADKIRERAPVRNIADMIEAAQVPGVLITRGSGDPGAPSRIRIRGLGSISQSNDPVMIVDGIWVDATVRSPSRIDEIDPATIETIEIVRGPSAATLYGQDAANGVIVITTKKGKAGPTRWTFSYNRDWGQTYGKSPEAYLGFGYHPILGTRQACPISSVLSFYCIQDSVAVYDPNSPLLAREGIETNNRFVAQVDGGSEAVRYAISGTVRNTIGVRRISPVDQIRFRKIGFPYRKEFARPSALNQRTMTSNLTLLPNPKITLGFVATGGQSALKDNSYEPWFSSTELQPDRKLSIDTFSLLSLTNRIRAIENPTHSSTVMFSGNILWNPVNWTVRANAGIERNNSNNSRYEYWTQCNYSMPCTDSTGIRQETAESRGISTLRINTSTLLNLGRWSRLLEIRPAFGGDYRKVQATRLYISKYQVPPGERSLSSGEHQHSSFDRLSNATAGWYLNSTVGLLRRLYFDVGIRQDIGSAITSSSNSRYPKLGGSWLISDEGFWPQNSWVSMLRFRGAMGYSAVQPDVADIRGRYMSGFRVVDGKSVRTVELGGIGNPQLEPERAMEIEIGFDTDLFFDRVNFVATYAHGENRNVLITRSLPPSVVGNSGVVRKENVAGVRNRNIEITTNARVLETRRSLLVLNYNLTVSDNVVTSLGKGIWPSATDGVGNVVEGYPLAGVWSRRVMGYRDINDDGLLSLDEVILTDSSVYVGWNQPRYRAGYGFNMTFQSQLVFDARFAYKSQYVQQYTPQSGYGAQDIKASFPEQAYAVINGLTGRRLISDLRWNSASLTYHLRGALLQLSRARSLSISLQGNNLALWTNYDGRDPGVNANILTSEVAIDNGNIVPRPRLFVLDFKIGL